MNDKNKKSTSASRSNLLEGDNGGQKVGKSDKKFEEIHFVDTQQPVWNYSLFSDEDIRNFQQGTHYRLYDFLGTSSSQYWIHKALISPYGHPMPHS